MKVSTTLLSVAIAISAIQASPANANGENNQKREVNVGSEGTRIADANGNGISAGSNGVDAHSSNGDGVSVNHNGRVTFSGASNQVAVGFASAAIFTVLTVM